MKHNSNKRPIIPAISPSLTAISLDPTHRPQFDTLYLLRSQCPALYRANLLERHSILNLKS